MTLRELPPSEWWRLWGTEPGNALAIDALLPTAARILIVEDQDEIVGCWALVSMLHAEGAWIAPARRGKAGVARRLHEGMRTLVQSTGCNRVISIGTNPDVRRLLAAHGAIALPGAFLWSLERSHVVS